MKKILILMYHMLSKEKVANRCSYAISEKDYHQQLQYLHDNGYNCILCDDYYQFLINPTYTVPEKSVILTFDDGHESDFTIALPLLKQYGFKASFFITTDWIGKSGYMSAKQLRILKKEGMSVQSHAKSHIFLDELDHIDLSRELGHSKNSLEDVLGEQVSFISFPGGRYNNDVIDCAKAAQYLSLFTSAPFTIRKQNQIYLLGRYVMQQKEKPNDFVNIVNSNRLFRLKKKFEYNVKYTIKKTIGNSWYHHVWKAIKS